MRQKRRKKEITSVRNPKNARKKLELAFELALDVGEKGPRKFPSLGTKAWLPPFFSM